MISFNWAGLGFWVFHFPFHISTTATIFLTIIWWRMCCPCFAFSGVVCSVLFPAQTALMYYYLYHNDSHETKLVMMFTFLLNFRTRLGIYRVKITPSLNLAS